MDPPGKDLGKVYMLVVAMMVLWSVIVPVEAGYQNNLIAFWPFDEGQGNIVHDHSGKGNHGIIYGATWVDGISGKALYFDHDYVDIPSSISPCYITIAAWIYVTGYDGHFAPIITKETGAGPAPTFAWRLGISGNWPGDVGPHHIVFEASNSSVRRHVGSTSLIYPNRWYHVAGTFDGEKLSIFVNGILESEVPMKGKLNTASLPTAIGHLKGWGVQWFKGIIDDLRIYNRALSEEEIQLIYSMRGNVSIPSNYSFCYLIPFVFNRSHWSNHWHSGIFLRPVQSNTSIWVDNGNDGYVDMYFLAEQGQSIPIYYPQIKSASVVYSSAPLQIYYSYHDNDFSIYDDCDLDYTILPSDFMGTSFWIPTSSTLTVCSAIEDGTVVKLDTDSDGIWERQTILNRGEYVSFTNLPPGSHIEGSKPLSTVVLNYDMDSKSNTYGYTVIPQKFLTSKYVVPLYNYDQEEYNQQINLTGIYLVSVEDDNLITIDGSVIAHLDKGEVTKYTSPIGGEIIRGTRKFFAVYIFDAYEIDPWTWTRRHQSRAVPLLSSCFSSRDFIFYGWYDYGTNPCYDVPAGYRFIIVGLTNNTVIKLMKNGLENLSKTVYVNRSEQILIDAPNADRSNQVDWYCVRSSKPVLVYVSVNHAWGSTADAPEGHFLSPIKSDTMPPLTTMTVGDPHYNRDGTLYTTSDTPIYLNATDYPVGYGCGIREIHYSYDNGTTWYVINGSAVTFTIPDECQHKILYYAIDYLGNVETVHSVIVNVDSSPPETRIDFRGPCYEADKNMWITSFTPIYLSAVDHPECSCGVDKTYYRINRGDWKEYTGAFYIGEECSHTIEYYSVDYLGNVEPTKSITVNVDNSAPVTLSSTERPYYRDERGEWITSNTSIYLNSTDYPECACGVKEIYYSYDNGTTWFVVNGSKTMFNIPEECVHVIKWYAVDNLGNTEEIRERVLRVDNTPPETTLVIEGHYSGSGTPDDPYRVTPETRISFNASDKGKCAVGVRDTYFRIRTDHLSTKWMSWKSLQEEGNDAWAVVPKAILEEGGPFYLEYYSEDLLGNKENTHTVVFYFEKMQHPSS